MRSTPQFPLDGMLQTGDGSERFDDGLVHNHHWAVTADEAYPSHDHGGATGNVQGTAFVAVAARPSQGHSTPTHVYDRHDDGLVHNHEWAVTGK